MLDRDTIAARDNALLIVGIDASVDEQRPLPGMKHGAKITRARQIGHRFDAEVTGYRRRGEIDAGLGGARLHAARAVVAVVEADDREVLRLFDADGGERTQRHQNIPVAGHDQHALVRLRQREAEPHRRRTANLFVRRVRSLGIRDRPTSPRSPWQNGYAERLIGSIRRECLDHVVVFGERHLRHLLLSYVNYYNSVRTHLSLAKDAPARRAVHTVGRIQPLPVLGGLHHQYIRI